MSLENWSDRCEKELNEMCNAVFETPEVRHYFETPLTWPGDRVRSAMTRH